MKGGSGHGWGDKRRCGEVVEGDIGLLVITNEKTRAEALAYFWMQSSAG